MPNHKLNFSLIISLPSATPDKRVAGNTNSENMQESSSSYKPSVHNGLKQDGISLDRRMTTGTRYQNKEEEKAEQELLDGR